MQQLSYIQWSARTSQGVLVYLYIVDVSVVVACGKWKPTSPHTSHPLVYNTFCYHLYWRWNTSEGDDAVAAQHEEFSGKLGLVMFSPQDSSGVLSYPEKIIFGKTDHALAIVQSGSCPKSHQLAFDLLRCPSFPGMIKQACRTSSRPKNRQWCHA